MPPPLILVIDDTAPTRYALGRALRQHGFAVIDGATGREALDLAERRRPDLVLLDVNLPDIHGFDVARELKQRDRTKHIPILQISASSVQAKDRTMGLASGADGFLVAPVEPEELVANIRALLRMRDAEEGLQRSTAMLAAVFDASPLPIIVFDRSGAVRTWNHAAERLFGYEVSEVAGVELTASAFWDLETAPLIDRLERGETVAGLEQQARRKDGTTVDVAIFAAPLAPASTGGYAAIVEDISGRKRYERDRAELLARERDARRDAEAASRLKDEFLATLSHELRTPLNAIMGWASMLRHGTLDEESRTRALDTIERNATSQASLISDILEVSRIIRGQLRLDLTPMDVVAAVRGAIASVRPAADAKGLQMTTALDVGPVIVAGDRERMQQIFWNLLSNAVKYTPRDGRVHVAIRRDDAEVSIDVRDSGIGIEAELLPHVFERFRQGDMTPTRDYGGLGLGLAIVRHLTDAHGGSVRAESGGTGRGALFTVTLPLAAQSTPS